MIPFVETLQSKEELDRAFGEIASQKKVLGQNALLSYFGFVHGEAIEKFYPGNEATLMTGGGIPIGSIAYFQAGINAWKNLRDGKSVFPPTNSCYKEKQSSIIKLRPGDSDGSVTILDEDKLCFSVLSECNGKRGIRTISKTILLEFINYELVHSDASAQDARDALSGSSQVDKYEYGYNATIWKLVKLNKTLQNRDDDVIVTSDSDFISIYTQTLPVFWKDERYKWEAVKCFQENWDIEADDFVEMFKKSTAKCINLLAAYNYYPAAMIADLAGADKEGVRNMFRVLFDESKDLAERLEYFPQEAERIRLLMPEKKNHYQNYMAMTVYLTLMYPEKYYIYKYTEVSKAFPMLGIDFEVKRGAEAKDVVAILDKLHEVNERLMARQELKDQLQQLLLGDAGCYADPQLHIATVDFIFYLYRRYAPPVVAEKNTPIIDGPSTYSKDFAQFVAAIKTKPFVLLAGISGTGKSRIVRQLARACDTLDAEPWKVSKPSNFEMIQVRPDWHDSSELLGYESRISGSPEYVVKNFVKFIVKAWLHEDVPFFLCLDEMNLAPVEQYFAEYLSVVETRHKDENGNIVCDPLIKLNRQHCQSIVNEMMQAEEEEWDENTLNQKEEMMLLLERMDYTIPLPKNLIVMGTVNMDETTFSFSRKVLDRAMTIEMNEVNLKDGLVETDKDHFHINANDIMPDAVEGKDVYAENQDLCNKVIAYLEKVNEVLDGTPFKIAYRTRNEFLLYAVNRGEEHFIEAMDEMTSMKILSRIEGDIDKVGDVLSELKVVLEENGIPEEGKSLPKLTEMGRRLQKGYTSYWS